ncbi:phosphatidylinositol-3,5-bisphosphate 3-phosphatase MTMR8-like [Clavelina lepadiformis]|uniref:phosphatidylinositol-3,5-bisphosphate 3-phosphatase MTMR8-like n=1 Tax=Clavelina lepadiformis TaxID=159417 RepID=UPI004043553C
MEHIKTPKVGNVRWLDNHSRNSTEGTLYLTATHLIFVDVQRNKETWIVHTHIQSVEKLSIGQAGSPLRIRCKTFQVLTFLITQERDCHDLYSSLLKLSKPVKIDDLYAFSYNPRGEQLSQQEGWDLFSLNNDYMQMGLPTRYWKVSRINNEFGLCDTYPRLICVPSLATPALLMGSAAFRSKRRLPVLSYLHENGSVIVRCSQPMAGLNSRSIEDEAFVDLIRRSKSGPDDFMYIVDTRPMLNAVANRAQGKGYENTDLYENIKYHFLGIENIHVMRNSLNKLLDACEDSTNTVGAWLEAVNNSGWLKHVHNVIQVSRFIAHAVGKENRSVMVHCSDGWDRTAQTCSLAAIMLNPHYRTIDGFLALVQKEWLHFGHKFMHRLGHLDGDPREVSPVFTQFIDAVWQLMRLYPCSFQFNEQLLFDLHDHAYSCQFGTFLGNCAKDRQVHSLTSRTYSLWGWMMKRLKSYTSPLYHAVEQHKPENKLLLPPKLPHCVRFWRAMYNRFDKGLHPRQNVTAIVKTLYDETAKLTNDVASMRKRRNQLRQKLGFETQKNELTPQGDVSPMSSPSHKATTLRSKSPTLVKIPRRPASTDDVQSLAPPQAEPQTLRHAVHSTPDIASISSNKKPSVSIGGALVQSSDLVVSFSTQCLSDSDEEPVANSNNVVTEKQLESAPEEQQLPKRKILIPDELAGGPDHEVEIPESGWDLIQHEVLDPSVNGVVGAPS